MRNIPAGKTSDCQKNQHRACPGKYCRCYCHLFDDGVYGAFEAIARMAATLWSYALDVLTPRKRYEAELAKLAEAHGTELSRLNNAHRRALEAQAKVIQDALKQMMKVTAQYQPAMEPKWDGRFAITTFMSDDLVRGFTRTGMPKEEIWDMISHQMSHEFRRQFAAIDFARVRAMSYFEEADRAINFGRESFHTPGSK